MYSKEISGRDIIWRKKGSNKVGMVNSIRFTIACVTVVAVLVTTVINMALIIPGAQSKLSEAVKNNMLSLAESYGMLAEEALKQQEPSYELYEDLIGGVKVEGVESSYIYIVASDGIMQYHPKKEKYPSLTSVSRRSYIKSPSAKMRLV